MNHVNLYSQSIENYYMKNISHIVTTYQNADSNNNASTLAVDLVVMFIFLMPYVTMFFTLIGFIVYQRRKQKSINNTRLFIMILPIMCLFIITTVLRMINRIIDYENGESDQQSLPVYEHSLRNRISNGITLCLFMCIEYIIIGIFLYINYVFIKTCEKLDFMSKQKAKVIKLNLLIFFIIMGIFILMYMIMVMVDRSIRTTGDFTSLKIVLVSFYSIYFTVFTFLSVYMLVVLIGTSVLFINKMVEIKKEANKNDKTQMIKIALNVVLISVGISMNCLTLFISLLSEFYEENSGFVISSLIMRAISVFFLCLFLMFLFSPFENIKDKISDNVKRMNRLKKNKETNMAN